MPLATVSVVRSSILHALLITLALVGAACTSSLDSENGTDPEDDSSAEADVSIGDIDPDAPPVVPGAPLNPFDLRAGQCFNEGTWYDEELERRIDLTASVECTQPHQKEVFHEAEFPAPNGAPFPGEAKMTEWSTQLCYDAFPNFVGSEYELSVYDITFLQPTQATFEHAVGRHRRVTCFLFDPSEDIVSGTARGSGL
ncbi:MAG: hypothetical protein ACI81L_003011 [Verrucomicrobiales bacterium]